MVVDGSKSQRDDDCGERGGTILIKSGFPQVSLALIDSIDSM